MVSLVEDHSFQAIEVTVSCDLAVTREQKALSPVELRTLEETSLGSNNTLMSTLASSLQILEIDVLQEKRQPWRSYRDRWW